jgi:fatty acid desaturase
MLPIIGLEVASNHSDDDDRFDGIDIELPFFTLRAGRGRWDWEVRYEDDDYRRARRKVRARLAFFRHVVTYVAVVASLMVLDAVTGGGLGFSLWVAGIWGALLVWQAFSTFVFPWVWSRETEERMIQEELKRQRGP